MLNQIRNLSTSTLLISYCTILLTFSYLIQSLLMTDTVIYNSYVEVLSYERIEALISSQKEWIWLSLTIPTVIYLVKFFLVACCLLIGAVFFDIKLRFKEAFKIALIADTVFLIPMVIKIFWFSVVDTEYVLQDIQTFSPLSAKTIFGDQMFGLLWFYPLQTINLFELSYILFMGYLVFKFGAKSYEQGLGMVVGTYVPALFIWIVTVMFVTLTLNPTA